MEQKSLSVIDDDYEDWESLLHHKNDWFEDEELLDIEIRNKYLQDGTETSLSPGSLEINNEINVLASERAMQNSSHDNSNRALRKKRSQREISPFAFMMNEIEQKRLKMQKSDFIRFLFPKDLRMSYARIIVDAFNTGNCPHLQKSLWSFCASNFYLREYFYGGKNPYGLNRREMDGVLGAICYFYVHHQAVPDNVMRIDNQRILQFDDIPKNFSDYINSEEFVAGKNNITENKFTFKSSSRGIVFIYDCAFTGSHVFKVKEAPEPLYSPKSSVSLDSSAAVELCKVNKTLRSESTDVKVHGYWIIVLNDAGKIQRFEFHLTNAI